MEQDRKWKKKPTYLMINQSMTKKARKHNAENTIFLISGSGETGQFHVKE